MSKYQYIVWDFNGTIINDVDLCIFGMNKILADYQLPLLDKTRYEAMFTFPAQRYYQSIGLTDDVVEFTIAARRFISYFQNNFNKVQIFDDIEEVIKNFREIGLQQVIISATKQEILDKQVSDLGIVDYFNQVIGTGDIYALGKVQQTQNWLDNTSIDPSKVLWIGDTEHDYECASEVGIDTILIARGHVSKKRLQETGAIVVDMAKQVLAYVLDK